MTLPNPFANWIARDPDASQPVNVPAIHGRVYESVLEELQARLSKRDNCEMAILILSSIPGAGKTHLLGRLVHALRQKALPVFIPPSPYDGCPEAVILRRLVQRLAVANAEAAAAPSLPWLAVQILCQVFPAHKAEWQGVLQNLLTPEFQSYFRQWRRQIQQETADWLQHQGIDKAMSWAHALCEALLYPRREAVLDWLRAQVRQIPSHESSEELWWLDPSEIQSAAPDRLLGLLQILSFVRPAVLVFDQVENFLVAGTESLLRLLLAIQSVLQRSPATQVVLAANLTSLEILEHHEPARAILDRLRPLHRLGGLQLEEALALRDARAEALGSFGLWQAREKIPEAAIRQRLAIQANGEPAVLTTPRDFLQWCSQRWENQETSPTPRAQDPTSPDLEAQWAKTLEVVKQEGLGFFPEALEAVYLEVWGARKVVLDHYNFLRWENIALAAIEASPNWLRWEAIATRADQSRVPARGVLFLRPSAEAARALQLAWKPVPGERWHKTHALRRLLDAGATLRELGLKEIHQALAASRFLDLAADLGLSRASLAEWLHKSGHLRDLAWPPNHMKSVNEEPEPQPPALPKSRAAPIANSGITVMSVTQLAKLLVNPQASLEPSPNLTPSIAGTIFHELAAQLTHKLRSDNAEANSAEKAWQEMRAIPDPIMARASKAPEFAIFDAMSELARNLDGLRQSMGQPAWKELLIETEKSFLCSLGNFEGVEILISGRCDLLRRHGEGGIEIVDYKLGSGGDESGNLLQLALYAQLLGNSLEIRGACLEIYHPKLQIRHFSLRALQQYFEDNVSPALVRLAAEAKRRNPALSTIRVNEDAASEPLADDASQAFSLWDSHTIPAPVRQAFEGFVGNEEAVNRLMTALADAFRKPPPYALPAAYLFTGPAGTGKTELALRTAKALGLPFIHLQGSRLRRVEDLFVVLDRELENHHTPPRREGLESGLPKFVYPPVVLFIDEAHELGRQADRWLGLFEPRERRLAAADRVAHMPSATFLAATTNASRLPKPFLTRFLEIPLRTYTENEVAEILRLAGVPGSLEFRRALARACRLQPRQAKACAEEFERYHCVRGVPYDEQGLTQMRKVWGVTDDGLSERDTRCLQALQNGPASLAVLAQRLRLTEDVVEEDIEPYLVHLGFIEKTSRGRVLTALGRQRIARGFD